MNKRLLLLLIMLSASSAGYSQQLVLDDLKDIAEARIRGEYRCAQTTTPTSDVVVSYELRPMTTAKSAVTSLAIKGAAANRNELVKVNSAIGNRGIETVTVSCSSKDVRIIFGVFDSAESKLGYVTLTKRKDAPLEVSR